MNSPPHRFATAADVAAFAAVPLAQRIAVHILVDVHPTRYAIEAIAGPFQRLPSAIRLRRTSASCGPSVR